MPYSHASQLAGSTAPSSPRTQAEDGTATELLPVPMVEGAGALKGLKLAIKYPGIELTHIASTHNSLARILHEDSKPQGGGSAV